MKKALRDKYQDQEEGFRTQYPGSYYVNDPVTSLRLNVKHQNMKK